MSRVVVIGAGVGGLATAARLAALGHDVTVCEQAATIGGKLGTLATRGFSFDTGPSLVTMPHVFRELFASTGDPLESAVTLQPVEPIAHYRFADGTELDSSADLTTFCDSSTRRWARVRAMTGGASCNGPNASGTPPTVPSSSHHCTA